MIQRNALPNLRRWLTTSSRVIKKQNILVMTSFRGSRDGAVVRALASTSLPAGSFPWLGGGAGKDLAPPLSQGKDPGNEVALASQQCGPGSISARCHMWVEFVVRSRLCSEGFFFLRVLQFSSLLQIPIRPRQRTRMKTSQG